MSVESWKWIDSGKCSPDSHVWCMKISGFELLYSGGTWKEEENVPEFSNIVSWWVGKKICCPHINCKMLRPCCKWSIQLIVKNGWKKMLHENPLECSQALMMNSIQVKQKNYEAKRTPKKYRLIWFLLISSVISRWGSGRKFWLTHSYTHTQAFQVGTRKIRYLGRSVKKTCCMCCKKSYLLVDLRTKKIPKI